MIQRGCYLFEDYHMKHPSTLLLRAEYASLSNPHCKCFASCHGPAFKQQPSFQIPHSIITTNLPSHSSPQCLLCASCWLETHPFPAHPATMSVICFPQAKQKATSFLALHTENKSTHCSAVTEVVSTRHHQGAVDGTWCPQD